MTPIHTQTLLLFAATVACTGSLVFGQEPAAAEVPAPLHVHEWGTFTSMVGSDGVVLEGLQHEEERLPEFVHELASLQASVAQSGGYALKFPATRVTQKMETPVVYFHTDVPREVHLQVTFPQGLMTQFYPIPMVVRPAPKLLQDASIDLTEIKNSQLMWNVELIPFGAAPPTEIPECDPDDPWSFARQVRAAYVRTKDPKGVERATEAEHYLFYRGLGRFALPFGLVAGEGGRGEFENGAERCVPYAAVLEVEGDRARFVELGKVEPQSKVAFSLDRGVERQDKAEIAAALGAKVFEALVAEGLYEDEARAMIATWSRSWFQSEGRRAIYLLPQQEADALLPMSISPRPTSLVRVFVGRLEYISPEAEARFEAALLDHASRDAERVARAKAEFVRLDRFLEPHLRRALGRQDLESVARASATELLDAIVTWSAPPAAAPAGGERSAPNER